MNISGVKRAKYVLMNLRVLNARIIEREKARREFENHIEKLKKKPTLKDIDKTKTFVKNLALQERKIGYGGLYESEIVKSLKKRLLDLKKINNELKNKSETDKNSKKLVYITSKPYSNPKSDLLREHLEELENKLKISKLSKVKVSELNKKIKFLKSLL